MITYVILTDKTNKMAMFALINNIVHVLRTPVVYSPPK